MTLEQIVKKHFDFPHEDDNNWITIEVAGVNVRQYPSPLEVKMMIENAVTEVWNEAIKECEGSVSEEGIKWMQEGFNKDRKGYTKGFNSCREQTLQAISKLRI